MTKKELEQKLANLEQELEDERFSSEWLCEKSSEDDNTIAKLNTIISCLVGTIEQLEKKLRELKNGKSN